MMHTLPRPLQDLLLPPNAALVVNRREAIGARRRRRAAAGGGGFYGGADGDGRRAIERGEAREEGHRRINGVMVATGW